MTVFAEPTWATALGASLVAGLATGAGALPAAFVGHAGPRAESAMMGFAAGVMLAASFFSLLLPALEQLGAVYPAGLAVGARAMGALVLGALVIGVLHRLAPHAHFLKGKEGLELAALRRVWLLVIAISLHNVPEGLAVGVGVATGEWGVALPVTVGIALQNAPEGLVVALALIREDHGRAAAIAIATATGLVEPIASVLGFLAMGLASGLLPYGLAFAAGAMIYVVSDEIIPESHRAGFSGAATWGTVGGFALMGLLDAAFA